MQYIQNIFHKSFFGALILFAAFPLIGQSNAPLFKSSRIAEYSAQRDPMVSRELALKEKVSEINIFDASGKLSEQTKYQAKDLVYEMRKITWSTDSMTQTTITFDGNGNIKGTWESNWSKSGYILGATNKDDKGKISVIQTNEYDEQGNLILRKMENVGSNRVSTTSFIYDTEGNVIESTAYNPYRDRTVKRTFQYDKFGNEILQELFKGPGQYTKFVSENDEHGNLIEQYWYDKEGELKSQTSFSYVYDLHGNWITKIRSTNQVVSYVWEREITYW